MKLDTDAPTDVCPQILGILNVTPDSFSDGGEYLSVDAAIEHAIRMTSEGALIIDVGGESTRPGALPVGIKEEIARVVPVVVGLVDRNIAVSVDTLHSEVAAAAIAAGATFINDVSGGLVDPAILDVAAGAGVCYVAAHWGGGADAKPRRGPILESVITELSERLVSLGRAGIDDSRIIVDPGLGFGKSTTQNWELLAGLARLRSVGMPVLVGHSRKRFVGALLGDRDSTSARDGASAAISLMSAEAGAWGLRVHNVGATRRVLDAAAVGRMW